MSHENHLYVILFPTSCLVGSQLAPAEFARHFNAGSSKFYTGKLIFAEVDIGFRHPYFRLEEQLKQLVAHEDGRPKATKYFSHYRVLEHLDFAALGMLYISTPEGYVLDLKPETLAATHQPGQVRIYGEISPISMMVLSDLSFPEYGAYITQPDSPIGAPKMFYTQIDVDIDDFLKDFEDRAVMPSPIPDVHPSVLRDSILELRAIKGKHTKGLSMSNAIGKLPYRLLKHGFMFASAEANRFYRLPSLAHIEKEHPKFWKYM